MKNLKFLKGDINPKGLDRFKANLALPVMDGLYNFKEKLRNKK